MRQLRIALFTALLVAAGPASAQAIYSFKAFPDFLDVPDGIFWNDVSGALQFCGQDELRASFHRRLADKKYGRNWALLTATERASINQFIMFGTGVARGLALSSPSPSTRDEICTSVEAAANAYIAAEA